MTATSEAASGRSALPGVRDAVDQRGFQASAPGLRMAAVTFACVLLLVLAWSAQTPGPDFQRYRTWARVAVVGDIASLQSEVRSPLGVPLSQWSFGPGFVFAAPAILLGRNIRIPTSISLAFLLFVAIFWWSLYRLLAFATGGDAAWVALGLAAAFLGTHSGFYSVRVSSELLSFSLLALLAVYVLVGRCDRAGDHLALAATAPLMALLLRHWRVPRPGLVAAASILAFIVLSYAIAMTEPRNVGIAIAVASLAAAVAWGWHGLTAGLLGHLETLTRVAVIGIFLLTTALFARLAVTVESRVAPPPGSTRSPAPSTFPPFKPRFASTRACPGWMTRRRGSSGFSRRRDSPRDDAHARRFRTCERGQGDDQGRHRTVTTAAALRIVDG